MLFKILSRFTLTLIIVLIVASVHWTDSELYHWMHGLGVDIPMTPFTANMTLMLSKKNKKEAYYKKFFHVHYQTGSGYKDFSAEKLGWYEFKAAFQWLSECKQSESDCPEVLYYLCRSLEDYTKTIVISWSAVEDGAIESDPKAGFGVEYRCPIK